MKLTSSSKFVLSQTNSALVILRFCKDFLALVFATILVSPQLGMASTTYNYTFTANTTNDTVTNGYVTINNTDVYPSLNYDFPLTNNATRLDNIPAVTLTGSDTINITINFDSPWTMPATTEGAQLDVTLQPINNDATLFFSENISIYNNGVQVTPSGFPRISNLSASSWGYFWFFLSSGIAPTPSFTFNRISFTARMTKVTNASNQVINSVSLGVGSPKLMAIAANPVPEVDNYEMFLVGILIIGYVALRKSKKSR